MAGRVPRRARPRPRDRRGVREAWRPFAVPHAPPTTPDQARPRPPQINPTHTELLMLNFIALQPGAHQALGILPTFLDEKVPLPAWQQIDDNYKHGGGWFSFKKNWNLDLTTMELRYPGDPPMKPIAYAILHGEEHIYVYPHAWVLILQTNMQWDLARID